MLNWNDLFSHFPLTENCQSQTNELETFENNSMNWLKTIQEISAAIQWNFWSSNSLEKLEYLYLHKPCKYAHHVVNLHTYIPNGRMDIKQFIQTTICIRFVMQLSVILTLFPVNKFEDYLIFRLQWNIARSEVRYICTHTYITILKLFEQ